jgi:hypothetical protein
MSADATRGGCSLLLRAVAAAAASLRVVKGGFTFPSGEPGVGETSRLWETRAIVVMLFGENVGPSVIHSGSLEPQID